jgi:outer membrane protein assembly factor BamB
VVTFRDTPTYGVFVAVCVAASLGAGPKGRGEQKPFPTPFFPLEVAWTATLDTPPAAGGGMDDASVYLPLRSGEVIALARASGRVLWRFTPAPGISAPLAIDGDLLVAVGGGGEAIAVSAETGVVRWRRALGASSHHPPAIGAGIAFALEGSRVVAVDRVTGVVLWSRTLDGILSAPAVARGLVLVGSSSNYFHALKEGTGYDEWTWRAGGDVIGAAAENDLVYFASLDNVLHAVNRGNGNQRWKAVVPFRPVAPPVSLSGVVIVAGVSPRVDGFLSATGQVQGTYSAVGDLQGTPLVDSSVKPYQVGMVAIARDGRVIGLRPQQLMMRDPTPVPLIDLPGRRLSRERLLSPASPLEP